MVAILSVNNSSARAFSESFGFPLYVRHKNRQDRVPEYVDALIRWGCVATGPETSYVFNTPEAINRSSDKKLCRELLYDAGIPVPEPGEDDFPCVGRRQRHRAGKWLFYCENERDVERAKRKGAAYFSKFYPKQTEYRVHIGHGKVILYSTKVGGTVDRVNWNYRKGEVVFKHLPRDEWDIEIIRLAKKAIKVIGLDFGAVDILANPTDPELPPAVVCEINTAPTLSPMGVRKYMKYFYRVLEEEGLY